MAKRFTCTDLWKEDWFIELPIKYQHFFFYLKDHCDHAGIWKKNKTYFERVTGYEIDIKEAINLYNEEKERFAKINGSRYIYLDFFVFQYGSVMNLGNRVHKSIYDIYEKLAIDLRSIRGLLGVKYKSISPQVDPQGYRYRTLLSIKEKENIYKLIIKDKKIKEKNVNYTKNNKEGY